MGRKRKFGKLSRGGRFDRRKLTPRQKARIERRRRKFFQEDLEFDKVRRNNKIMVERSQNGAFKVSGN